MQLSKILIMIVSLTLINGMSVAVAQDTEKSDGIARVVLITPRDGQSKELEKAITAYHKFMGTKEGSWRYQWYSIVTGPDTGKYVARSGGHNWADFDAEHDWDKEAGERFMADVQPFIENATISITRTDYDLGIWPDSMDGYQYFMISNWYVNSGMGSAYNKGLKKIDAMLKEGGWPSYYRFIYNVSGGKNSSRTLVSPRKNFADMAPKEPSFYDIMKEAMGEEESETFMSEWGQTYHQGSSYMIRYRPELSDYSQD